ncbi:uncharacterized protein LOC134220990 [Armigeres subalbatus]|uniref:uncharacterized protein LOC134220990 n=1 Tax=Armigeres subalbatus TaxID=124917 RepID=UPI002ED6B8F1
MFKLVLCLSALGLVACYDFKDSFYNELVLEDILDSEDTPTLMDRFKRSTPEANDDKCKRNHHRHRCCNDANGENMDKFRDTKKQCFSEVRSKDRSARGMVNPVDMFDCEKMNKTKQEYICAVECVSRKFDVIDQEGNLLGADKLIQFTKDNFAADPWQESIIEGVVDTCLKEVAEKNEKLKASGETTTCNPASSNFGYCMWRQMTLACPKDKQEQSKKCERMRERFANNELVSYHKHDFDD